MTTYAFRELPTIDDPDLLRCCMAAQQMRSTLSCFVQHIVAQFGRIPVTIPARIALAVLDRMAEGSLSTELLCAKNRVRDAAILILSLFELRLDLEYISLNVSRADTWIDHAKENTKPWRVASQLKELYTDMDERNSEMALYRQYSMVKHSNPVGRVFSFPLVCSRDAIEIDLARENSDWVRVHLLGLGHCIERAAAAASHIWESQGFAVASFAMDLKHGFEMLSRYNEEHIVATMQSWKSKSGEK